MPTPGRLYLLPSARTVLFREAGREGDECEYWPAAHEAPMPEKARFVSFAHGWLDKHAQLLDWHRRPVAVLSLVARGVTA